MFRHMAAAASRMMSARLPFRTEMRRGSRLRVDELSEYMLRDLGLADGHAPLADTSRTGEAVPAASQRQLILTPVAS